MDMLVSFHRDPVAFGKVIFGGSPTQIQGLD
jgi:hypothetical protein